MISWCRQESLRQNAIRLRTPCRRMLARSIGGPGSCLSWATECSTEMPSGGNISGRAKANARDCVACEAYVSSASAASWEDAGRKAVETAATSIRDLRVAEVGKMDTKVENGKVTAFRTRVALSFKYEAS